MSDFEKQVKTSRPNAAAQQPAVHRFEVRTASGQKLNYSFTKKGSSPLGNRNSIKYRVRHLLCPLTLVVRLREENADKLAKGVSEDSSLNPNRI